MDQIPIRGIGSLSFGEVSTQELDQLTADLQPLVHDIEHIFEEAGHPNAPTAPFTPAQVDTTGVVVPTVAPSTGFPTPLVAAVGLGGAYMAYKAGSVVGGLVAAGAFLYWLSHTGAEPGVVPAAQPVVQPIVPLTPVQGPTEETQRQWCEANDDTWEFSPISCSFGVECPQHVCIPSVEKQRQTCELAGNVWTDQNGCNNPAPQGPFDWTKDLIIN